MAQNQVAFAFIGAIDALVVAEHVVWVIFSSMSGCVGMDSSVTADDLHPQWSRDNLTTKAIIEASQMTY